MRWKALDHLARCVVAFSSVALVLLVVLTGWQVWGRYVLNDTPTWTEKAALLLILIVALPMAAIGLRENFHLGIGYVSDLLPPKSQRALEIANSLVLGGFGVAMVFGSWPLVIGTWGRDIPLLGLPQGLQYAPLILTGSLIVLFMVERVWFLAKGIDPAPPRDDAAAGGA
ncbi:MAG: TRAP transporter small permease [Sedimentitalea sp.]|uniref:TRAP transporter small permease n=1 Tax=Sedimentitalea sp. TaxID=2048915 RepID=UPI003265C276